jgi:UDP-GlcNAc3NAcA epimerase
MKIISVVGARPQFVKAAVLARALAKTDATHLILHTGQHYDENMSAIFFDQLDIPAPTFNLNIGSGSQGVQTAEMLMAIEKTIIEEKPDWLVLYGDTNSTLAGALAASKLHVPVAHVEAGLRSFNKKMPEEVNRIVTDHVSEILFTPTQTAVDNLVNEGVPLDKIKLCGDVMYDAALYYLEKAKARREACYDSLDLTEGEFILSTIHRAENTDHPERLDAIVNALEKLSADQPVVLPLHPRTRSRLSDERMERMKAKGVKLVDPLDYLTMLNLMSGAVLILTDSGGVQKEAWMCGTPCVTLRDETEWVELIMGGYNTLVPPTSAAFICEQVALVLESPVPDFSQPLYGDGDAGGAIARALLGPS